MYTPENITKLNKNEILVFETNGAGRHSWGYGNLALKYGAKYGVPFGLEGQTFAIPTKTKQLIPEKLYHIETFLKKLYDMAVLEKNKHFLVTKMAVGIGGYPIEEVAPLFRKLYKLKNVSLPEEYVTIINQQPVINF